jgi:GNAT superfamily N-acetyltransferase
VPRTQIADIRIDVAEGQHELHIVRALFLSYARSLPVDLAYQHFESELATLPGQYVLPRGALILARRHECGLGCVALRALPASGCCEMKRLFVVEHARGLGLGRALVDAVMEEARLRGYIAMHLDTLPTMSAAIRMYEQAGFTRTAPYYSPTPAGTVFMSRRL